VPPELLHGPFTVAEARRAALSASQLRSGCWRRLMYGVYCHTSVPDTVDLRVAAARKVLPPGAAVSRWTAAWLLGVDVRRFSDQLPVATLAAPAAPTRRAGLVLLQAPLPESDLVDVGGVLATSPRRTAFDLARTGNLIEGVVALDALLRAEAVSDEELAAYFPVHRRWRGVRTAQRALGLADRRAESPMESRLRMVIVLPGLPAPEPQIEIADATGAVVFRLDLGHRSVRRAYEFDGRFHAEHVADDHLRRNALRDEFGWDVRVYTAADVYRRYGRIVTYVASGLGVPPPRLPPIMGKWLSGRPT
jgi:hypothetical protein